MKVLAVEDDNVSRAILKRALEGLGHEVIQARDGEEAWTLWLSEKPRVVVSDWQMPKLDGLKLCRRFREMQGQDYVYFILLTSSHPSAHNRRAASEAGVDDFLTKPIDVSAMWMRLRVAERILKYTTQVHQLEEMMPMCSYCKKIRDDKNYWQQIESYINERTGTEISHSVCPECYQRVVVPELERLKTAVPKAKAAPKAKTVKKQR
ncbi:MAG TPA: response regulator [Opitutaceae bacterium]|jgi:DNA-binding response OmpR family regulator|nr:response regulator [Opitutaceae bacterium]